MDSEARRLEEDKKTVDEINNGLNKQNQISKDKTNEEWEKQWQESQEKLRLENLEYEKYLKEENPEEFKKLIDANLKTQEIEKSWGNKKN